MTSVVVLGASGMLGSMVTEVLASDDSLQVVGTVRTKALVAACRERLPGVEWRQFDADGSGRSLASALDGADWVVNAIGLTKPYVHDDDPLEVERAVRVNAVFPFALARAADATGAQVVQIATDCVYSGAAGAYTESAPHDALDVYGKTKSLGEAAVPGVHLLRCSIIGPEPKAPAFLLEWLRRQPEGATVTGFTDHLWNGVTTFAFARLCRGLVRGAVLRSGLQHVIPAGDVTKADLLRMIAGAYSRDDITVDSAPAPYPVDRTLRTEHREENAALWGAAGYEAPPSVAEMVAESAEYAPRLSELAS
jgi:dTDP-4-dehydrorhamnose reductase